MAEKKKKSKKLWMIAGVVVIVILISLFSLRFISEQKQHVAVLYVDNGDVEVWSNGEWQTASEGMELGVDDMVRTLDGEATLIFSNAIITNLDPHTEVSIKELSGSNVAIKQTTGSTWNKFLGIAGIKQFEVETPMTVATVRGTEFGIDVVRAEDERESYEAVIVAEGEVLFGQKERSAKRFKAKRGEKLVLAGALKERVAKGKEIAEEMAEEAAEEAVRYKEIGREIREDVRREIQRQELTMEDKERMVKGVVKTIDKMKIIRREQLEQIPELRDKLLEIGGEMVEDVREMGEEAKVSSLKEVAAERELPDIDEELDKLAALRPELMKHIPEELREEETARAEMEKLLALKEMQEEKGMEAVNTINEKIRDQLELLQELQEDDKEMDIAVHKVLRDPDFKEIIEPIAEAEEEARERIIERGMVPEEELGMLEHERLENLRRALEQETHDKEEMERIREEEMLHEKERLKEEQMHEVEEQPFVEGEEPIHVWTPEGEFLEYSDGRIEPVRYEKDVIEGQMYSEGFYEKQGSVEGPEPEYEEEYR